MSRISIVVAVLVTMIYLSVPAFAGADPPDQVTAPVGNGSTTVITKEIPGPPGPQGAQGIPGAQGPQGPPPSDDQVRKVVEAWMATQDGLPVPESHKPILQEMVNEKFVVGYPDGSFKWSRRATRDEVTLIVQRVYTRLQGEFTKLSNDVDQLRKDLGTESDERKAADTRLSETDSQHNRQLKVIFIGLQELEKKTDGLANEIFNAKRGFILLLAGVVLVIAARFRNNQEE